MLEWLFGTTQPATVYPPTPPIVEPSKLPYDSAHVLLHGKPDVPFYSGYWDYPLRGPNMPEVIYSEKMVHAPLFSSKHQVVNSQCAGKLHFSKSLHPESLTVDNVDKSLLLNPRGYTISSVGPREPREASVETSEPIPVNFRIGGAGPGGPEMSFHGSLSSTVYQKYGPHFLGKVLKDGTYCVEPSTMEERANIVYTINGDDETVREFIIKTS